jgi:DNA-binding MarR family transcriptional regulator
MCQKDILSRMIAPNSNLTLIIRKLKTKNYIKVIQSKEDKREYVINITKEGLAILKVMDKILKQQKEDFNNLSDTEASHLNALLNKIRS